ncbi:relaxase/mobilization nuclease domain protein (plasmid) [Burkholderia gladioli]|uniref:TraI/MobA(P) family conjugative relaxase n=1 Tax=Burkholderia gladioli TaxID=28095 RepID=UPI0005D96FD3|nr:TraI/MobA(P) family conjugative relaxase [Burkholderia gladioli]AJW93567.1 relaxase/mobilization nuclease domain protein [Burkholderia gladioli]ASD84750.1 polyprotein [Burkholderia gladioli pv. gladioli]AWY52979.1 polyprotein [Burkholderia gladioli pv. gladioli]SPV21514.1 relaxase/mobilization nuclease domain protein [Burkholderia gladioli]
MIFKKVPADRVKSKAKHVRDLTDYIRDPAKTNPHEKVAYTGARGFLCADHAGQQSEMIALAMDAPRSANPINHYILSWREGEYPTPAQVEQAVEILLAELGLAEHQALYALHQDTDNMHLHIAVNRVHPDTLKVIKPNKGFDKEAGHRAIAKIEAIQGWASERNARYQVDANGEAIRGASDGHKAPSQKRRDMEVRTGEQSAERIAIEAAAPIIRAAANWAELHAGLQAQGFRYERKGSGAIIWIGDVPVKASSADRGATLAALQKRLGEFQPAAPADALPTLPAKPIKATAPRWAEYIAARRAHYQAKNATQIRLREKHELEREGVSERQHVERTDIMAGKWRGKGKELNVLRSVMAADQAAMRLRMQDRQRDERRRFQERFRPFPSYEDWLRSELSPEAADQWRYRDHADEIPARIVGDIRVDPVETRRRKDLRDFEAEIHGDRVAYHLAGRVSPAFVDRGDRIDVHDADDEAAILAALQLSAEKWGAFQVTGSEAYKARCARLAARYGFVITNPELQTVIRQETGRLAAQRGQAAGQIGRPADGTPKRSPRRMS